MKKAIIMLTLSALLAITTVNNAFAGVGGALKLGVDMIQYSGKYQMAQIPMI